MSCSVKWNVGFLFRGTFYFVSFLPPWPTAPSLVEGTWGQLLVLAGWQPLAGEVSDPLTSADSLAGWLCVGSYPTLSQDYAYPGSQYCLFCPPDLGLDKPAFLLLLFSLFPKFHQFPLCSENCKSWTPGDFMRSILKHLGSLAAGSHMETVATFVYSPVYAVCHVCIWVLWGWWAEESAGSHRAGTMGGCKLAIMGVGSPTLVLWKSKKP